MIEPKLRRWINATAELYGLPDWHYHSVVIPAGVWLEALMLRESSHRVDARRYEPHLDRQADGDSAGRDDGVREDDASYGPMQVLGLNVESVFKLQPPSATMDFAALNDWLIGCGFGMSVLKWSLRYTKGNIEAALAVYNGGPRGDDRMTAAGEMRNQQYVDKVWRDVVKVMAHRAANGVL
jgi:hypothetical protein